MGQWSMVSHLLRELNIYILNNKSFVNIVKYYKLHSMTLWLAGTLHYMAKNHRLTILFLKTFPKYYFVDELYLECLPALSLNTCHWPYVNMQRHLVSKKLYIITKHLNYFLSQSEFTIRSHGIRSTHYNIISQDW